ncbi:MAG: hypothetical protein AAF653_04325 [Chloroflexota bacterium]
MNIFGIGGWELALVVIIMLVVAGPKRMAQWAYTLGRWTSKLRVMWEEVADVLQKELDESGIDVEVPRTPPTRDSIQRSLQQYGKQVMEEAGNPEEELRKIKEDIEGVTRDLNKEMDDVNKDVKAATAAPKKNGTTASTPPSSTQPLPEPTPEPEAAPVENSNGTGDTTNNDKPSNFGTWGGQ